jgi:hypothetical protein
MEAHIHATDTFVPFDEGARKNNYHFETLDSSDFILSQTQENQHK